MRYSNDTMNLQNRPCGGYSGVMPAMTNQGAFQPQLPMFNGSVMGTSQQVPTGFQIGGTAAPIPSAPMPSAPAATATTTTAPGAPGWTQMPTTVESPLFTPGFLRTQIGRRVRVEFLIGTNNLTDRTGTLVAVGASYILIRPIDSDDVMLCDIYSIKFVTIIH